MEPTHPEPSDETLMAAYVSGERRAFETLFARLAPRLHRFFRRSFGAEATADDLLQQTFLKLHRARGTYDPTMRVAPWAFAIASRVRLDEFRRRKRLAEDGDEEALGRAVDALPESQRVVIHLNRFEGMTFGEIARVLGTTEGAVKLRPFRAYATL